MYPAPMLRSECSSFFRVATASPTRPRPCTHSHPGPAFASRRRGRASAPFPIPTAPRGQPIPDTRPSAGALESESRRYHSAGSPDQSQTAASSLRPLPASPPAIRSACSDRSTTPPPGSPTGAMQSTHRSRPRATGLPVPRFAPADPAHPSGIPTRPGSPHPTRSLFVPHSSYRKPRILRPHPSPCTARSEPRFCRPGPPSPASLHWDWAGLCGPRPRQTSL